MPPDPTTARELLDFYLEAGADARVGEEPADRFAESAPAPRAAVAPTAAKPAAAQRPVVAAPTLAPAAPEAAAMEARAAAKSAATRDELRGILERFEGCALKATASRLVFADGNPQARLMLVGEAPGRDEDVAGLPFVGRSGKLLDRMLKAIGLERASVYIANVVPCHPPGNRTPTPQETQICLPFIKRQIELVEPDVLVCLGGPSSQTLLGQSGITKIRGRWLTIHNGAREIRAMPTFHPTFLLRSPLQKRFAWRENQTKKKALNG